MNKAILTIIISAATITIASLLFIFDLLRNRFDPLNPKYLFIFYYCVILAVYPIYAIASHADALFISTSTNYDLTYWFEASVLVLGSLLMFIAGTNVRLPKLQIRIFKQFETYRLIYGREIFIYILCASVAAFFTFESFFAHGGLHGYYNSFLSSRYDDSSSRYVDYFATAFYGIIAALLIAAEQAYGRRYRRWILATISVGTVTSLLTGFRIVAIPLFLIGISYYHYYIRALSVKRTVIVAVAVVFGLAGYGTLRHEVESRLNGSDPSSATVTESLDDLFTRLKGGAVLARVMEVTETEHVPRNYLLGGAYESATIFLPRRLFIDKPTPQSVLFGRTYFSDYLFYRDGVESDNTGGIAPSVVAYLYWQTGIFGALLLMFVLGVLFSTIYEAFIQSRGNPVIIAVYLALAPNLVRYAEAPQDALNAQITNLVIISAVLWLWGSNGIRKPQPLGVSKHYPMSIEN